MPDTSGDGGSPLSTRLRAVAQLSLDRWQVPGAAVGVLQDGQTSFGAFGVSSLETMQPVTPDTLFRVASITKPFTATLAMTLVNDGLLDLDRPIADYLPGVPLTDADPPRSPAITMRHLLSHTAGVDCELAVDLASFGSGDDALGAAIARYGEVHQWAAPGEVMSYGNTGFWLAGHVVATILRSSFENAMHERVLRPLGLQRTVFTAEAAIVYPVALGHQPVSPTDATHELIRSYAYPRARTPSGGVISTVVDLLEFARWHLGESAAPIALAPHLRDAMRDPVVRLRAADNEAWGLGWRLSETDDGVPTVGHGGSFGGFQTLLTVVPSRRFAVVVLTNSARGSAPSREIERFALGHEAGLVATVPRAVARRSEDLIAFAGTWREQLTTYEIAVVTDPQGSALDVTAYERGSRGETLPVPPPMRMRPIGDDDFLVMDGELTGTRADFLRDTRTDAPTRVRIGMRIAHRVADRPAAGSPTTSDYLSGS